MDWSSLTLVTIDFETYWDSEFSLTKIPIAPYVRDERFAIQGVGIKINDGATQWYPPGTEKAPLAALDWSRVMLLCQNTFFDGFILTQLYGHIPAAYLDTKDMAAALWPHDSSSLKAIAIRLWPDDESKRKGDELVNTKGIRDLTPEQYDALGVYCVQDVDLTWDAFYNMLQLGFPEKELRLIDECVRMFCEPKLVPDAPLLQSVVERERLKKEAVVKAAGVPKKVLSSNQQYFQYLQSLGLNPPTKPHSGKKPPKEYDYIPFGQVPAFSKTDIGYIRFKENHPELNHLFDARTEIKSTIASTRAQRFLDAIGPDGTIPAALLYYGAHTGRFSGTQKTNMQNLTRGSDLRLSLCAPEGQFIYVTDLSAIEARVVAWLADCYTLLDLFSSGVCVYCDFGGKIYERPINKKDDPLERHVGKTAQLGLGFGQGHKKFHGMLETGALGPPVEVSPTEAERIVNLWRATYPEIQRLWTRLELKVIASMQGDYDETWRCLRFKDNSIILPNGLAIKYKNLRYENGQLVYDSRSGPKKIWGGVIVENIAQALARIILTDAWINIADDPSLPGNVVLQVHDELLYMDSDTQPYAIMDSLNSHMSTPKDWATGLPLAAEGGFDIRYSK
jgi:DNA polymerase